MALPESGNPVWAFPTAKTDLTLIQDNLNDVVIRANSIASMEPYSAEYNSGMLDIHVSLETIQQDMIDAMPPLCQFYQHHAKRSVDSNNNCTLCYHKEGKSKVPRRRIRKPVAFIACSMTCKSWLAKYWIALLQTRKRII